jgi:hypothetical protein
LSILIGGNRNEQLWFTIFPCPFEGDVKLLPLVVVACVPTFEQLAKKEADQL